MTFWVKPDAPTQRANGPVMIRNEDRSLTGYVCVKASNRDPGNGLEDVKRELKNRRKLPAGYVVLWGGRYESTPDVWHWWMGEARVTIAIILFLLYIITWSIVKTMTVTLAVAFSAVGATWFVHLPSDDTEEWQRGRRFTMIGRSSDELIILRFDDIHAVDSPQPNNVDMIA